MESRLIVLAFEGASTAEGVLANLKELEAEGALKLKDAVIASRPGAADRIFMNPAMGSGSGTMASGTGVPAGQATAPEAEITQTDSRRGRYALAGGGIGVLIGTVLGGPIGGLTVGLIAGALRDRGLSDKFVKELSATLRPDTSAVFLLIESVDAEKALAQIRPFNAKVLNTNLPPDMEEQLRQALKNE